MARVHAHDERLRPGLTTSYMTQATHANATGTLKRRCVSITCTAGHLRAGAQSAPVLWWGSQRACARREAVTPAHQRHSEAEERRQTRQCQGNGLGQTGAHHHQQQKKQHCCCCRRGVASVELAQPRPRRAGAAEPQPHPDLASMQSPRPRGARQRMTFSFLGRTISWQRRSTLRIGIGVASRPARKGI